MRNPQVFQKAQSILQSNGNKEEFLQQLMGNMKPEQKENILRQAQQMGCPQDILTKVQNMK